MGKRDRVIRYIAYATDAIMLLLNLRLALTFSGHQTGDAPEYVNLALRVINDTGFYPVASDFVGVRYIHNPGMVNYLALLFSLTGDIRIVFIMNILFAQVILFSSRFILGKITSNKNSEYLFQILFCLYFSLGISGGIVSAGVEYTFTALTFLGIALFLTDKAILWLLAGIILSLANYVRPIFAFVIIPVGVFVFCLRLKDRIKRILVLLGGIILSVVIISCVSYSYCGRPVYQATTMWSVFIVGNNPIADGNNTTDVFKEGNYAYVSPEEGNQWTCDDYDEYNKELVMDWVKQNPGKAISLIPRRLFYFWAVDTYFISAFSDNTEPADKTEYMLGIIDKVKRFDFRALTPTMWMSIATQTVYMLIILLGILAIILQIKHGEYIRYLGVYVLLLLGNAAYALTYGCARYHFMYMVTVIMLLPSIIEIKYKNTKRGESLG